MSYPTLEISASRLNVSYESQVALNIPALNLEGGIIALVGHNGAGKSTLIKSILGLLPITSGNIASYLKVSSNKSTLMPEEHMAFCPETGAVFSDISVESYIKLWCRIKHDDAKFYMTRGSQYVEALNLSPLMKKLGRELSKGQKRRVQTAIGFLTKPKLFLFDEPFDGLDVQRTSELADMILAHRSDTTFIVSSHRMDVMERMADKVLLLKQGQVASAGSTDEVCCDIAGQTYILSKLKAVEKCQAALQAGLPNVVVAKIGKQLFLTGKISDLNIIQKLLGSIEENEAQIEASTPRLVEAMNYHLTEMNKQSLH